ncbi:GNAT family N-acetyltransferase [Catenulispora sp. NF23]|uniref:GNAT family N-acetyltransferase n=1 Tax=Catenulispora pinistramenti TaxID=2705254 RepID=A0ABS5KX84_9ACTN|nr:GNAT family N-acetyltransferase [Catenulispora pinistramenti]MBS2534090.1 GNAT family N-acetyltransferase [Catenulispora pinistramenti]MBS2550589.1 GNAT family N-acetyltransferase [Catenulispora pinistramenti]
MPETVTYVEMASRDQFTPSPPVSGLTLDRLEPGSPLIAEVMAGVGAPYGWKSARRGPEEWVTWLAENSGRDFWLLALHGEPAGIVVFDPQPGGEVEIKTFGLLPAFVGKGFGGYALTLGVDRAWQLLPEVTRVWLHTQTSDHPHALSNYHGRGFRTFKTEPA